MINCIALRHQIAVGFCVQEKDALNAISVPVPVRRWCRDVNVAAPSGEESEPRDQTSKCFGDVVDRPSFLLLGLIVSFLRISAAAAKWGGRKRRPQGQEDPLNFLCPDFVINDCHLFPCHFDPLLNLKYSSFCRWMQRTAVHGSGAVNR